MNSHQKINEKDIDNIPTSTGVYIFYDERDKIVYVGKAKNLRARIRSHLTSGDFLAKSHYLKDVRKKIEYILTADETEALIFEYYLIKKHLPRYNVMYRDDKSYPYLTITLGDKFPRASVSRGVKKGPHKYYGPFTHAYAIRETLDVLRTIFPIRTCRSSEPGRDRKSPCLNYHIKRCLGPCTGTVDEKQYRKAVSGLCEFLEGNYEGVINNLWQEMERASKNLEFEKATLLRNQIQSIKKVIERIKDIAQAKKKVEGKLKLHDQERKKEIEGALKDFKDLLGLSRIPRRIECYDISTISGRNAVGSMVVFENGWPKNSEYKRFRIKFVKGLNDLAMMREVIERRLRRLTRKDSGFDRKPDLIIVDGGRGQLNSALEALKSYHHEKIPVVALAKRLEEIYLPGKIETLILSPLSQAFYLIQRIRDEAHRFALSYHRLLRKKEMVESLLDGIPGIGKKRKEILFNHFKNMKSIEQASVEQLKSIKGIPENVGKKIYDYFHS